MMYPNGGFTVNLDAGLGLVNPRKEHFFFNPNGGFIGCKENEVFSEEEMFEDIEEEE